MRGTDRSEMVIGYRLRFLDVFFMYEDTWPSRVAAAVGAVFMLVAVLPPVEPQLVMAGLAIVAFAFLALPAYISFVTGSLGLIGRTIRIVVTQTGVQGWPKSTEIDRSWGSLRSARVIGTVLLLPFHSPFGARTGWVGIPLRAMTSNQRAMLWDLLEAKRLLEVRAPRRRHSWFHLGK
ncbi:MAG: hypothetical protein ACYDAK_06045 [Candidatus Limnocylindrales bacterium]